uniref:Uncharacterized protein n=1 Tax=Ditylenchus dipsaci TaxID=166011 RepID=A0A915ED92_9BILA
MTRKKYLTKFDNNWKVYLFVFLCVLVCCSNSDGALCTTCCPINCCRPLSAPYYYGAQGIAYPIDSPELQNQLQDNIKSYPNPPWNDCSKRFSNSLFPSWSEAVNAYRHYYSIYDDPRKILSTKGHRQKCISAIKYYHVSSTATTTSTTTPTNPTSILSITSPTPTAILTDQQNVEFTTQSSTSQPDTPPAALIMAHFQPVQSIATEAPV